MGRDMWDPGRLALAQVLCATGKPHSTLCLGRVATVRDSGFGMAQGSCHLQLERSGWDPSKFERPRGERWHAASYWLCSSAPGPRPVPLLSTAAVGAWGGGGGAGVPRSWTEARVTGALPSLCLPGT